jgi:glycosyltransferase involved in cell wall biosynthesis
MKIGIDARLYGTYGRGIGRYIQILIEQLEKLDHKNEYAIFLSSNGWHEYTPKNKNFKKVHSDIRLYTLKEQLQFPRIIAKQKVDIMHFPHFTVPLLYNRPYVVTVHDMIIHKFPTEYASTHHPIIYKLKLLGYKLTLWHALKAAKHVIAISKQTKQDILKYYPALKTPLSVIHHAIKTPASTETAIESNVLTKWKLSPLKYFFYVGAAYPHKNLKHMIESFMESLNTIPADTQFVIAGRVDTFHKNVQAWIKKNYPNNYQRVQWVNQVSDTELSVLYTNSIALVYVTQYEGFGLPVLEAMAANTAVIASNNSSLKEVAGPAGYLVQSDNSADLQKALEELSQNRELRDSYIQKGREQLKKFSTKQMAYNTWKCYQQIN